MGPRGRYEPLHDRRPFIDAKELLAGFWLWQVEWLKRAPFDGGTELEIRPVFGARDVGEEYRPEPRAEERTRAEASQRQPS